MLTWETERLLLRPLVLADLDALYQLYREPRIMQYITGQPRSYEMTRQRLLTHIAGFKNYGFGLYATILKATGELIGRCGMEPIVTGNGLEANLAWIFAQPYWGRGLATEFARAMIPYGFTHFPIVRMFASADPANLASIRVMQKAGMTFVLADKYHVEYEVRRSIFEIALHH